MTSIEYDFTSFEPSDRDIESIKSLLFSPEPNRETPSSPPSPSNERFEITGDTYEGDLPIDPSKRKQENDEDKSNSEPTKH